MYSLPFNHWHASRTTVQGQLWGFPGCGDAALRKVAPHFNSSLSKLGSVSKKPGKLGLATSSARLLVHVGAVPCQLRQEGVGSGAPSTSGTLSCPLVCILPLRCFNPARVRAEVPDLVAEMFLF